MFLFSVVSYFLFKEAYVEFYGFLTFNCWTEHIFSK